MQDYSLKNLRLITFEVISYHFEDHVVRKVTYMVIDYIGFYCIHEQFQIIRFFFDKVVHELIKKQPRKAFLYTKFNCIDNFKLPWYGSGRVLINQVYQLCIYISIKLQPKTEGFKPLPTIGQRRETLCKRQKFSFDDVIITKHIDFSTNISNGVKERCFFFSHFIRESYLECDFIRYLIHLKLLVVDSCYQCVP